MSNLPAIYVSECDTDEYLSKKPKVNSSISYRSSSVKPSIPSSRSRTTLGEYDADLDIKVDTAYGTTSNAKAFTWVDHLLAVFCIHREGRVISFAPARSTEPQEDEGHYISPWVLPVYVLSSQKDESGHFIPKEAKCTIDTGNLQGNIISKAFVTDVLGYHESSFQQLTKLEEAGGTGVTGHKLIPEGAIYLTWYHSNSTRVFRGMRFLISEHPMYDLIIGSRSIHQNRILDVPNLMGGANIWTPSTDTLTGLREKVNDVKNLIANFEEFVDDPENSTVPSEKKEWNDLQEKLRIAEQNFKNEERRLEGVTILTRERDNKQRDEKGRHEYRVKWHAEVPDKLPVDPLHPKAGPKVD